MNRILNRCIRGPIALVILLSTAWAADTQPVALMSVAEAEQFYQRTVQLLESTMITVPGLARAAEPILENTKQSLLNLRASPGQRNSGLTYLFLMNVKAYQALADSIPKPYPFPVEASRQFGELRTAVERIDSHFRALLDRVELLARNPDRDNVARYEEANEKVGPPAANNTRVVFLGDSITDGWRLNEYFPDRDFINRGISGQVTGEMLGRMQADVINLKPSIMVLLAGTNDIARGIKLSTIQNNISMIVKLAEANKIKVILASVLPINDYNKDQDPSFERSKGRPPVMILRLNTWLKEICARDGHQYLDYFTATADTNGYLKKELADDGLHPNSAGYRTMAPLVEQAIDKAAPASAPAKKKRRFPFGG